MKASSSAVMATLLLCAGMSAILAIYFFLLWCSVIRNRAELRPSEKEKVEDGLSASELENLPKVTGKDMAARPTECAVCLEQIEDDEMARVVPGCNHCFHLECADTWLSKHSVCPLCRAQIRTQFSNTPENLC